MNDLDVLRVNELAQLRFGGAKVRHSQGLQPLQLGTQLQLAHNLSAGKFWQGNSMTSRLKNTATTTQQGSNGTAALDRPPVTRKRSKTVSAAKPTHRSKASTFRGKSLEEDFLRYCQLTTVAEERPLSAAEFEALVERADHIDNPEFASADADAILGNDLLNSCEVESPKRSPKKVNLPPHLAGLCEARLLDAEQERKLFQRMNFLRYRALKILQEQPAKTLSQWDTERVSGLLKAADWHRDVIVQANVRLVISIVKKFSNQQCGFDDLLSDGIMALIRSVDKFDYQLGFRFSTYATQVVRRNSYRFVMDRQDERLKVVNSISDGGLDVAQEDGMSSMDEVRWNELRSRLQEYLGRLEKREKFIVRARFSLGGHRRVQTLQRLADRLGISKERVRQIEKRAMDKLAAMAREKPIATTIAD